MDTTDTKRKIIDIPEDVFRCLSVKAAIKGTNMQRYIEGLLVKDVEDLVFLMDDNLAYGKISHDDPDGKVKISEEEKQNFELWLGVRKKLK